MISAKLVRKSLVTALLAGALIVGASASSVGTVTASALNFRSGASTSSASMGLVYNGSKVTVLEDLGNGWYKVKYNGQTGYMSADYLSVTDEGESASESAAEDNKEDLGNGKVTLTSGTLNVRSGPSTAYSKVGSLYNGTVVELEAKENGWYKITYGSLTGYVSDDYIIPTTAAVSTSASASTTGAAIVAKAKQYLGCPYVYGASGPNSFDCSGFTSYIYRQFGYSINRTASTQFNGNGTSVSRENLQPGDLVFFRDFGSSKSATHVGIYIGNGQFIHASSSSSASGVKISNLADSWYAARYVGAKRIV